MRVAAFQRRRRNDGPGATVNKDDGDGKKGGSGRGRVTGRPATHKGRQHGRRRICVKTGGQPIGGGEKGPQIALRRLQFDIGPGLGTSARRRFWSF